jgi:multiple sugar transport system substrate-binding protein
VYTAAMSVYSQAKDKKAALAFFGHYVSKEGEQARLSGGGNAVPALAGLDDIVTEGNLPAHGKIFTEVAAKGYAIPLKIARNAKVATNFPLEMDKMLKAGNETPKSFAQKLVQLINSG